MGPVFPLVLDQNPRTPTFDESINDIPEERDDAGLGYIAPSNVLRRLNERQWRVVVLAQRNVEVPTSAFLHVLHWCPFRRSLPLILVRTAIIRDPNSSGTGSFPATATPPFMPLIER